MLLKIVHVKYLMGSRFSAIRSSVRFHCIVVEIETARLFLKRGYQKKDNEIGRVFKEYFVQRVVSLIGIFLAIYAIFISLRGRYFSNCRYDFF